MESHKEQSGNQIATMGALLRLALISFHGSGEAATTLLIQHNLTNNTKALHLRPLAC